MGEWKYKTMWLALSLCDGDGSCLPGFALEVRSASLHGLIGKDMLWDIVHLDGEKERIQFRAVEGRADTTSFFRIGSMEDYVVGIRMTGEYPS